MLSDGKHDGVFRNIQCLNLEVISEIQKDLTCYDIRSIVFLIYDDGPATALERLTLYQQVSKDVDGNYLNMLCDWVVRAQSSACWRYVFLEALAICQLYSIIRKIGFDVTSVKSYYSPDDINVSKYINPMKKILYLMCENMDRDHLLTLKKALLSYGIDVMRYDACELLFLDLINKKYISLEEANFLANIVERIPTLKVFATYLRSPANKIKKTADSQSAVNRHSASHSKLKTSTPTAMDKKDLKYCEDFEDVFQMLDEMDIKEKTSLSLHLKSDCLKLEGAYDIKNTKRIGVAYIINQEKFYPSKKSMENRNKIFRPLDNRFGSKRDKQILQKILSSYRFQIFTDDNLDSNEMLQKIKKIITEEVTCNDSIFILCILSHGIKGEVFASDSVSIKVEQIQNLLDSSDGKKLWGIPKVLIIQACQVVDDKPPLELVSDSPSNFEVIDPRQNYYLRKSDYLIFWATAPEYEAFRDVKRGSIFIQTLCYLIYKRGNEEHLMDIFTKVNSTVKLICKVSKKAQLPIFESTLDKKLYLCMPVI